MSDNQDELHKEPDANVKSLIDLLEMERNQVQRLISTAETSLKAIDQNLSVLNDAMAAASASLVELQSRSDASKALAAEILAAKTQVEGLQAVVAAKSDHIEQAQVHADKVRANMDRLHTQSTQKLNDVIADAERLTEMSETAAEQLTATKAARAAVDEEKISVDAEVEKIEAVLQRLQKHTASAELAEKKTAAYEERLMGFEQQIQERIATIDGLLPGATSAGLATAFDDRRQSFLKPGNRWQWVFVGALVALVCVAMTGLWSAYKSATALSYDELFRLWLARLPIAGALVWLAIYSSRESSLAKRLEEELRVQSCNRGFVPRVSSADG